MTAAAAPRAVRSVPATSVYLLALAGTTAVLARLSPRDASRLLLAQSTNLHHLARDPLRVLVGSAFWLSSPRQLLLWALLIPLVLGPVERRFGTRRLVGIFAAGHVGATLLTAAVLWVGVRLDVVDHGVVNARDVGVSYGFLAVAAVLTRLLPRALRTPYALVLVLYAVVALAATPSFTQVGHLLALAIGFACSRRIV